MRAYIPALLGLLLTACGQPSPTPTTEPNDGDPQGDWQLVEGTVNGEEVPILDDYPITLTIEGSQVGGSSTCNSYGGRLTVEGGRLRIEDLLQTMAGCLEEEAMAAEALYMGGLGAAESIGLDGDELLIQGPGVELRFEELAPPPTAELVDTVWILETLLSAGAATPYDGPEATLELTSDGALRGTTGCVPFEGRWVEMGDEIAVTEIDFPACSADWDDGAVRGFIGGRFRAVVDGDRVTLTDAGGAGLVYRASE